MFEKSPPISSLKVLIKLLKILGALPLEGNETGKIKSIHGTIYSLIIIIAYIILFGCSFPLRTNEKEVNYFITRIAATGYAATVSAILFIGIRRKNELKDLFQRIIIFDQNAWLKTSYKCDRQVFRWTLTLTTIATTMLFVLLCFDMILLKVYEVTFGRWFVRYISMFINTYYLTLIAMLSFLLYQRFKMINICLLKIWQPNLKHIFGPIKLSNKNDNLFNAEFFINIKILNEELRNLANIVCTCFSIPILISVFTSFVVITVQIFYLIILMRVYISMEKNARKDSKSMEEMLLAENIDIWKYTICAIANIIIYLVHLILVAVSFYYTKKQVCKIGNILKKQFD